MNPYQYVVLRCVPRVDREEFLNVGVVVYCQATEFLQAAWKVHADRLTSLDPRIDRDYYPIFIYPGPGLRNGDWVRKDAVKDPAKLQAVQHYAATTMMDVEAYRFGNGLDDCGPTLEPGQTIPPRP